MIYTGFPCLAAHQNLFVTEGKQMADKKKAKSVADVALYRCTVNLEEIFDFDLFCPVLKTPDVLQQLCSAWHS